ncbi:hypothetical protein [Streptomyces sp. NPDC051994]|uniref:hypothetical protein n=1 Tax=Streptomyces sp. NPDC051994 TaxID=3155287 RepID=UPI00341A98C4
MSQWPIRRPTEHAAIRAACRSPRPLLPVEVLLDRLILAYRAKDREGFCIAAHRVVRAALKEVGDQ